MEFMQMAYKLSEVEMAIAMLIRADGDHCSLCKRPLQHQAPTYYGTTAIGVPAVTSTCCRKKLANVLGRGLYVAPEHVEEWGLS
jgi:hypothetical protein